MTVLSSEGEVVYVLNVWCRHLNLNLPNELSNIISKYSRLIWTWYEKGYVLVNQNDNDEHPVRLPTTTVSNNGLTLYNGLPDGPWATARIKQSFGSLKGTIDIKLIELSSIIFLNFLQKCVNSIKMLLVEMT